MKDPVYLDTSAIVKLVINEPESRALMGFLRGLDAQPATSVITEVECFRAVSRVSPALRDDVASALRGFVILPLSASIRARAALLDPPSMRSLDAIHLATAAETRSHLSCIVSYDGRLNDSARALGLPVEVPV